MFEYTGEQTWPLSETQPVHNMDAWQRGSLREKSIKEPTCFVCFCLYPRKIVYSYSLKVELVEALARTSTMNTIDRLHLSEDNGDSKQP